jgi:DNA (cytosine-5)-methyltransferase 1
MTATITDLFCGAGGSSLGAEAAGARLVMAANHWDTAIEVHQAHFPDAGHDCADISQADPRRYPRTDILLASPECTNHSQARGVSRKRQDPTLWDAPDPAAERSRATMWDVPRFAEQMQYAAIVVENVVEATKWVMWPAWWQAMELLGYRGQVISHNSMHHRVPQSRDRIYVVWTRAGLNVDLEMELDAWCTRCDRQTIVRQGWKNGRRVGRYRQQWIWSCTRCGTSCEPSTEPAASIIDWTLDCPRIGSRTRPLAAATRSRILAGLQRYGWAPITTSGAGNVHERTPGNRARPISDPLPVQQTTATTALATPPGFLLQTAHGGRVVELDAPHPTVCASDDRHALVVPMRRNGRAAATTGPVPTVTAGGQHHGLLMRNNTGGPEMVTPVTEPARTVTTKGHQSLLVPDLDGSAFDAVVDECGFRMLEPFEIAAAMAFPNEYIPRALPKKDQVKLAGNAVTPPVMMWIVGRILQAMEAR